MPRGSSGRHVSSEAAHVLATLRSLAYALLALTGLVSCQPKICHFDVVPDNICAASVVHVVADATGRAELGFQPVPRPVPEHPDAYIVTEATEAKYVVHGFLHGPASQRHGIAVYTGHDAWANELPLQAIDCRDGFFVASVERSSERWDGRMRVAGDVSMHAKRTIVVTHDGRTSTLTPDTPSSDAFKGARIGGTWTFRSPLGANETCASIPDLITLRISEGVCDPNAK
jgi:hypothetical protein